MDFAFAGTPEFAAWVLADLTDLGRRPTLVISQPERPCGRGLRPAPPPAAAAAERLGIDCLQVDDINEPSLSERIRDSGASTLVVAAFGQILRKPLLDSFLCLNIHASLLPAYRGAAPIERALAAGEPRTGVSIMRITEGLDEGPWALQTSLSVGLREDAGTLGRSLALLGAVGMAHVLEGVCDGTVSWTEQEGPTSYASKLTAQECYLDVTRDARAVHDQVRSLSPAVGARAAAGGVGFKVWRTWPYGAAGLDAVPDRAAAAADDPGRLVVAGERMFVGCRRGAVEILAVQPACKKRMSAAAFLRGYGGRLGDRLEPPGGGGRPARPGAGDLSDAQPSDVEEVCS